MLTLKQQLLTLLMLDVRYFGADAEGNYLAQTILTNDIKNLFQEYPIGGVILFRENIDNHVQICQLTTDLQNSILAHSEFQINNPMLIAIDEEGGVISRIGLETVGNMALGAINNTQVTQNNAKLIGQKLSELGINFNFAPVVDINSNPSNPVIGVRSFGDDPQSVARHAKSFIDGLHEVHIISCLKHFPGHGDTATDTHLGITFLNKPKSEIEACELYPYKKLIAEGCVDAVMTAHLVVPALDDSKLNIQDENIATPATLSYEIITNILRKDLGFEGVIVTDALDMYAISNSFSAVDATIQSIKAGCDIILMPIRIWDKDGIEKFKDYFKQVYDLCVVERELQSRVEQSYQRIFKIKNKLQAKNDDFHINKNSKFALSNESSINGNDLICDNHTNQTEIAKKAVTLYKNSANHIPFDLSKSSNILIIANKVNLLEETICILKNIVSNPLSSCKQANIEKLLLDYKNIDVYRLKVILSNYSQVIVLTYNLQATDSGMNDKVNEVFLTLNILEIPYVMLSCRNPYDIRLVPSCNTNILIYGASGFDQTNYKISPFSLNLRAALEKILAMGNSETYNKFIPVML